MTSSRNQDYVQEVRYSGFAGVKQRIFSLLGIFLLFFHAPGTSFAHIITDIGSSPEPSVAAPNGILDGLYGLGNLTRVADGDASKTDTLWSFNAETATVKAVAKYAGYQNTFGIIDGDTFTSLFQVSKNGQGWATLNEADFINEWFELGIRTPTGDLWSSVAIGNTDGLDHMVTWIITGEEGGLDESLIGDYVVAFEDLPGLGSDRDFNDLVIEISGLYDQEDPIPEPTTLALMVLGLAGIGFARKKKQS